MISTDMSTVGQMQPLQFALFVRTSLDDAVAALRQQESLISESSIAT
ncbi:MAG: hypothetical protein V3T62_01800 [Alphaproteobacteria bacterium]